MQLLQLFAKQIKKSAFTNRFFGLQALILLFSCTCQSFSQTVDSISIKGASFKDSVTVISQLEKHFLNNNQTDIRANSFLSFLHENGYIGATIDSLSQTNNKTVAFIYLGNKFSDRNIHTALLHDSIKTIMQFSHKADTFISIKKYLHSRKLLIEHFENNGYPFSQCYIIDTANHLQINFNKNIEFRISDIHINGNAKIAKHYIYQQMGIKPDDIYSQKKIDEIGIRINKSGFLKLTSPPRVRFLSSGQAELAIHIKKKKANKADVMVGFNTKENNTGEQATTLNGKIVLSLINPFHHGETLLLQWNRPNEASQELKCYGEYKYLFSSIFGGTISYLSSKRDSSYIVNAYSAGIPFYWNGGNYCKPYFSQELSFTLNDKNIDINTKEYNKRMYGLSVQILSPSTISSFTSGNDYLLNTSVGTKTISYAIDSIVETEQIQINANYRRIQPVHFPFVLDIAVSGGKMISKTLLTNEMYKIGGFNSLRGFLQDEFRTHTYFLFQTNADIIINKQSFLYLFHDRAVLWTSAKETSKKILPNSTGAGMSYTTANGQFSLSYAIGRIGYQKLQFGNGIIHFGYTSLF